MRGEHSQITHSVCYGWVISKKHYFRNGAFRVRLLLRVVDIVRCRLSEF